MSQGLARRILRETASFAALQVVGASLVWLSNLALTRLLDSRAFGVYAIGTFFVGLGTLLGDGGLGAALLRKRDDVSSEEYRATVTFLVCIGATLSLALALGAPLIAHAWHLRPDEALVLRAMAPLYLVGPLRAVPYIRLERALCFARIAQIELAATIARQATAVALAATLGGAWALAGASLAGATVQLTLSYWVSPGWPGLRLSWRTLRPLLAYGARVQTLAVAAFFKDNVSAVLLGTILGPRAVGVFDFGVKYAQIPVLAVNALSRVQLPVYARLTVDDPTLRDTVRGALRMALLVGGALLVVMAVAAPWVVPTLFKPTWVVATPVIYGLLGNMAGGLLAGPLFALLQGQGAAGLAIRVFLVWTASTWILVLLSWRLGLGAVAAAHSVVTVAVVTYLVVWASRHLHHALWKDVGGPLAAGVVALGAGLAVRGSTVLPWWMAHPLGAAGVSLVTYGLTLGTVDGRRPARELSALVRAITHRVPPETAVESVEDTAEGP